MITPRLFRGLAALSLALGVGLSSPRCLAEAASTLPRINVNASGHYLETETGKPFFWLGDTGWKLLQSTTPQECSYYLRTRAAQGYTVIQTMVLAEDESVTVPNQLGDLAFFDQDPTQPNPRFFDHVVSVVDEAARLGLYMALVPTWGDKLTAPWGEGPRIFRNDNLPVARAYGKYLGQRLRDRTNVIWVVGGDRPAKLQGLDNPFLQNLAKESGFPADQDWTPIWSAMAAGLAEGLERDPLCIYHPQGGSFSSSLQVPDVPWIDVHGMQSGHGGGHDQPVWEWVARDYNLKPAKPTMDIEPNYEDHPYNPWPKWDPATGWFRDHDVRKQCYRSVFAGAAGVTYGHHSVWQFASARNGVINHADRDWIDGLHRPAAVQMQNLRLLIESRPFFSRVPEQGIVVGSQNNRALYAVACRDTEGTYAFIYVPTADQPIEVNLQSLRGDDFRAWWYDPRTGFAHPAGKLNGRKVHAMTSPSFGPDWVLVIDAETAGYLPPGVSAN